jgi:16S rRNA (uracil1498-N3)-methyltransferase
MRIPRIYVDLPLQENSIFDLPATSFQHVCKVLRLKNDYSLILFNGDGGQYTAKLINVEKRSAQVAIGAFQALENESPIKVTIGQTLSRGERMDYAIQKAVEAGVYAIQPLFSERCEVKLNTERLDKKRQHWQQIAISAAEQSGRGHVPQVKEPINLLDWVDECKDMLKITMHHHSAKPLKAMSEPLDKNISVLIGPEGGLTEEEVESSIKQGFQPVALGPRVLRTETAPIVILTCINLLWGDVG